MNFPKIDNLLNQIIHNDDSSISIILDEFEKVHIEELFITDQLNFRTFDFKDIEIKLEVLTSFIYNVYKSPELKKHYFQNNHNGFKKLLRFTFELYDKTFNEIISNENILPIVHTAIFGILSDKIVEMDYSINHVIDNHKNYFNDSDTIQNFTLQTWYLFLHIVKRTKDKQNTLIVYELINQLNNDLENVQNHIMKLDNPLEKGVQVSALANMIYVFNEYYYYIFHGKLKDNGNFLDKLDTYMYNAVKLADINNDNTTKQLFLLVRVVLEELYHSSIWSLAEITPSINSYISNMIESQDDLTLNLLPSQREVVVDLLSAKKSVVIDMPTSSGKTLLAQFYMLYKMQQHRVGNSFPLVCYVVPTNALINQVKRKFSNDFSSLDIHIETVLPFYNTDKIEEEILNNKKINILITTPEKLDFLIRSDNPAISDLKVIVMDEAHNLSELNRGSKFELLLSVIKQERQDVDFLLLSPFIKNAEEIAQWLGGSSYNSIGLSAKWTPNKQFIGYYYDQKKLQSTITYLPSARNYITLDKVTFPISTSANDVCTTLQGKGILPGHRIISAIEQYKKIGNILVLSSSPKSAEDNALLMLEYLKRKQQDQNISPSVEKAINIIKLQQEGHETLIECLQYGIAYHHARMSDIVKDTIESTVSNDEVQILFATTTLAQGMNFPVTTVIFESYERRIPYKSPVRIPSSEFWNIAGRAGRTFIDEEGHILLVKQNQSQLEENLYSVTKEYIEDDTKEIVSSLEDFFNQLNESTEFKTALLDHPAATNFLQYLNHIIRVIHDYDFNIDSSAIQGILNNSLVYRQQTNKQGFMQSQEKIRNFSKKYLEHIKNKKIQDLTLADQSGISDISLSKLYAEYLELKKELTISNINTDDNLKVSKMILKTKNEDAFAKVISILNKISEFKLDLGSMGQSFSPELIAKITIQWVNGDSIEKIAQDNYNDKHDNTYKEFLALCNKYINSPMKNFIPWGISVFQTISNDRDNEVAENLPSLIYYGVNNVEGAILSKIGVPRSMLNNMSNLIKSEKATLPIKIENMDEIKNLLKNVDEKTFEKYINSNIDINYYLLKKSLV